MNGSIEPWLTLGGIAAVLTAILVPLQGMMKEWLAYKGQRRDGATLTAEAAKAIPPAKLQDTIAMEGLIAAVYDCAKAIREGTAAESEREKDRLTIALERILEQSKGAGLVLSPRETPLKASEWRRPP